MFDESDKYCIFFISLKKITKNYCSNMDMNMQKRT